MIGGARSEGDRVGPTRQELMDLDIDLRLTWLWHAIWTVPDLDLEFVASCVRFAYGAGYFDALTEEVRGKLYREHAYDVPKRRPKRSNG